MGGAEAVGPETWTVSAPVRREADGDSRVTASVGGHDAWFESPDARLEPSPEAFATAFFLPALHAGAELVVEAPLDAAWLSSTRELLPVFRRWWGYPERYPVRGAGESTPVPPAARPARPKGLFFSGGADSFHSLLRLDDGFEVLVFIQGMDIRLRDGARMEVWERSFREIATQTGKRAVVVRTNLAEHPLYRTPASRRGFGARLAAVSHVLSGEVGSMFVSSSYPYNRDRPFGTHWETDERWSTSRTSLRHGDATLGHHQKLVEIAHEPLVAEWLRVCNEPDASPGNCSQCEKCLRTMVTLEVAGALEGSKVFDPPARLADRLDEVPWFKVRIADIWRDFLDEPLPPETRGAVRRLLRRSRRRELELRFVRPWFRPLRKLVQRALGRRR